MNRDLDKPFVAEGRRRPYEPPRLVRVAVRTTREHLNWQYAGQTTCTDHNHSSGDSGCAYPQ